MTDALTEQDGNKLFNEISKAIQDNDSTKLSELTEQPAPLSNNEEQPSPEQPEVPTEETPSSEETTPAEGEETETSPLETPADKTADGTPEGEEEPEVVDQLAKLKEQIEKLNKENHNLRSQAGRIPSVQKRIRELDKKLEELANKQTSPSSQPSTKIKPEVDELLKGIKETDPDLAEAIASAITKATEGVAQEMDTRERETLKLLREQESMAYQEMEANRLLEMYPNAADVFRSDHFIKWKANQPDGIRALAESNSADEVAVAFEKYAKDMVAQYPELAASAATPAATPGGTENSEQAKKIEAERQKRRATTANVSSPNASGKIPINDDPEALFEKHYKEIMKQISGA